MSSRKSAETIGQRYNKRDESNLRKKNVKLVDAWELLANPDSSFTAIDKLRYAIVCIEAMASRENIPCPEIKVLFHDHCCSAGYNRIYLSTRDLQNHDDKTLGAALTHEFAHVLHKDALKSPETHKQAESDADHYAAETCGQDFVDLLIYVARQEIKEAKKWGDDALKFGVEGLNKGFAGEEHYHSIRERIHQAREVVKNKSRNK